MNEPTLIERINGALGDSGCFTDEELALIPDLLEATKKGLSLLLLASYPSERKDSAIIKWYRDVIAKAEGK